MNKRKRSVSLLLVVVAVCISLFSGVGINAKAATEAEIKPQKQMYALEITTGSAGVNMEDISTIIISYKEKRWGDERVHAIYPKEDADHTISFSGESDEATLQKQVMKECEETADENALNYQFLPYSTRTLFFVPLNEIGEVTSIKILFAGTSGKWSIQGMRLIEVDSSVTPVRSGNAVVSGVKRECYTGKRIMEMQGKTYEIGWGDADIFREITTNSQSASYLKNFKETDSEAAYTTYDAGRDDYIIRLNIADDYMAGLESLANESGGTTNLHKMKPADLMYVTVCYEDIYGDIQRANVPVISNVLAEAQKTDGAVNGLAQQGDELAFTAHLYGFKKLITGETQSNYGMEVTVGKDRVQKNCYLTQNGTRANTAETIKDAVSLTDIQMYRKADVTLNSEISSSVLTFSFADGTWEKPVPEYYFEYSKYTGRKIEYNQTQRFAMSDNTSEKETIKTAQRDNSGLYLVEIDTADIDKAATADDLDISFTYKTIGSSVYVGTTSNKSTTTSDVSTGLQNVTNVYSIRDQVREFYGYWPASGDSPDDYAYHKGTQKGGKLYFLLSLSDVDTFVSATVSLNGKDEWQTSGIKISRVTSLSKRTIAFAEDAPNTVNWGTKSTTTDREIDRKVESQEIASSSQQVLVRANKQKTIYFDETKSVIETDTTEEWDPYADDMSYEKACTNLGFAKNGVSYDVDVIVAGSASANSSDGDCGSKNLFYFRLNFENGSSAYVLANQQLSADGFRTGQTERFSVWTNRDYGDLSSVDIIPDDTSSNSDVYDKLNIAKIRVNKKGNNSLNRAWEITNPGWIGIDYVEDGKDISNTGNSASEGRYAGEIVRSFPVDRTTYSVRLLFAISTGEYKEKENQFSGSVRAELSYTDSNNEPQSISFDLVHQLYEYDQVQGSDTTMETIDGKTYYVADNSLMFRGDSTDRFFLDLSDVKSLESLDLTVKNKSGEGKATWRINSVGVSLVTETGQMIYNSNNEYVYTGETKELTCQNSNTSPAYSMSLAGGDISEVNVEFKPNEITIDDTSSSSASATVTRKPSGNNDTLNFYIIPDAASRSRINNYNMKLDFGYVNAYGGQYVNGINTLRKNSQSFYVQGVSARNFNLLERVAYRATAQGSDTGYISGEEMVVQQVRSGVLLNTYRADMNNIYLDSPDGVLNFSRYTNRQTQTVSLYFGKEMQKQELSEGKKDVAVSIGFKTTVGGETQSYHSPYVFLTDEQYEEIYAGMIADVDFHIPYLSEITDVRVSGVGDVSGQIEKVLVSTYTKDNSANLETPAVDASEEEWSKYRQNQKDAQKDRECNGWYSSNESLSLKDDVTVFRNFSADPYVSGALVPVTVTLTADENTVDANADLSLVVKYKKRNRESEYEETIESVRNRAGAESRFEAEQSVTVQMMLSNVDDITGLKLKTTQDGIFYSVKSVEIDWNKYGELQTFKRDVSKKISNQYCDINFVNAALNLTATSEPKDSSRSGVTMSSADSDEINLLLEKGDQLNIDVNYQSSMPEDKWSYELYRLTDSGARAAVNEKVVTEMENKLKIDSSKLDAGNYLLVVKGNESDQCYDVRFTVEDTQQTTETSGQEADTQKEDTKKEDTSKTDTQKTDSKKEDTKKEDTTEDSSQKMEE